VLRRILLAACLFLVPLSASAQALDGDWNGVLPTPNGGQVRLLFQFHQDADALRVRLVSVDLGATAVEGAGALTEGHLVLSLPFIGGGYDGKLAADGKHIAGTWSQQGKTASLDLVPGAIAALDLHQGEPGDLTIRTPTGTLAGTILKKGPIGAVIITGVGPANRDGNSPVNGGPNIYRAIAEGLAAHDITSLRFDKRGIGQSAAALPREEDLRFQTRADDVKRWAATLKRKLKSRCVWLVGHSEGGQIAIAAAEGNRDICGLALLATPGFSYVVSTRDYFERNLPAAQKAAAFAALDALAAGRAPTDLPPGLAGNFRPAALPYQFSKANWDTAAHLAALTIPVLILQGDADMNVSVTDAKALAKARPDATLKILPGVNHSQRIAKDDVGTGPIPLAPGLTDTIAAFLKAHS
jgi:pimeloyl-ACP methyl ester carboxylesterase